MRIASEEILYLCFQIPFVCPTAGWRREMSTWQVVVTAGLMVVAGLIPVFVMFGRLWRMFWEFKARTEIKLNRLLQDRSEASRGISDDSKMGVDSK